MSQAYRSFFGFIREPFSSELKIEKILQTEAVLSVADRVDYTLRLGAMAMVTGDVVPEGAVKDGGGPSATEAEVPDS